MNTIRMFIGYDHAEAVAYNVFAHSVNRRVSIPVSITPIMLNQLKETFNRERHALQSNDFSFSRWLVPYLCNYKGWAIFADCDMLCSADIKELWDMRDSRYAVQVVKHDHKPKEKTKYLGTVQTVYDKKNWSSLMLMNCERCEILTPKYIERADGLHLHQFKWLGNDKFIGSLPYEWNHLVGYDDYNPLAKIIHFTEGGPYFNSYRGCEFTTEWEREYDDMVHCVQSEEV